MADYPIRTIVESTISILDDLNYEPPSLQVPLRAICYKIAVNGETEFQLRRQAALHGDNSSFWPGVLFGKSSRPGVYTMRSFTYDSHKHEEVHRDVEVTGRELRDNMYALMREIKERWAAGDNCPTGLDHSKNFWANGDLQLLEIILEKECLPESVKAVLADLSGAEASGNRRTQDKAGKE
jgi:hypothetical protein